MRLSLVLTACAAILVACTGAQHSSGVTYTEDVAPLYAQHCVGCHSAGGVAPFALDNYASAKETAALAKQQVQARLMPPWGVSNDGTCNTYAHARWLTDEEIATISKWVDTGAEEGPSRPAPTPPASTEQLTGEVLSFSMPTSFRPAPKPDEADEYRCFLIDPQLDDDTFITGFEVTPGNRAIVHHVLVFDVDPNGVAGVDDHGNPVLNSSELQRLQAQVTDRPGWECYGGPGGIMVPGGIPASWAPGGGVTHYPDDTAPRLRQGHVLVMQVHYHPGSNHDPDQTKFRLETRPSVAHEAYSWLDDGLLEALYNGTPVTLEPGKTDTTYSWSVTTASLKTEISEAGLDVKALSLLGVAPHMHQLGRRMELTIEQGGQAEQCAMQVNHWDFNWQQLYFYQQAIPLPDDATLKITCHYDTTSRDLPVEAGYGTNQEMCLMGLYLVLQN